MKCKCNEIIASGFARVAQSVEHFLGKEVVTGSTPVAGLIIDEFRYFSPVHI